MAESLSKALHPAVAHVDEHDVGPKKKGPPPLEGDMLCPLDEEKPVRFTSAAIPVVEAKAVEHRAPPLGIEESCSDDQPCAREDQNSVASVDMPFDAHAAGWEVVNGAKQRSPHEAKGKQPAPIPAPFIHPDCFEDPISNEFWEDVWVACAEHNVSALVRFLRVLAH